MKQLIRLITPFLLLVIAIPVVAQSPQQSGADFYRLAEKLYEEHKFDEALAPCLKARELLPNDYRPHAMAGFIYAIQHKYKESSDALAEAVRLNPKKEYYLVKARVDYEFAPAEAVVAARKAIEIDPNYAEAYAELGNVLAFQEQTRAEGIAALRTALRLNPKLFVANEVLGTALMFAKDDKGAEEAFRHAIEGDPKHMAGRFRLGRMLIKQGRLAEARKLWDERTSDVDGELPPFIELLKHAENAKRSTPGTVDQ
jgi:cytochrome c-type biogenesis protein CcmH/NrfG